MTEQSGRLGWGEKVVYAYLFRTEHIAWVSPPWESQEYVALDFPEAVFYDGELVFEGSVRDFTRAVVTGRP